MKCLILAAGYATRLYPLTENFPKPLLKVGEKTILDWLIDDMSKTGKIDEYIVVTNHKFAFFSRAGRPDAQSVLSLWTTARHPMTLAWAPSATSSMQFVSAT